MSACMRMQVDNFQPSHDLSIDYIDHIVHSLWADFKNVPHLSGLEVNLSPGNLHLACTD